MTDERFMGLIVILCAVFWYLVVLYFIGSAPCRRERRKHLLVLLSLLTPSPAIAMLIDTTTLPPVLVGEVTLDDCLLEQRYEQTTVYMYRTEIPAVVAVSDPRAGTGWTGGQPGRFVHCPEDCGDLVSGNSYTGTGSGYGVTTTDSETTSFTVTVNTCEDCHAVVPEPSTWALWLAGLIAFGVSGLLRKG